MDEVRPLLENIEKLYTAKAEAQSQQVARLVAQLREAQTEASRWKNKYEFLKESSSLIVHVSKQEIANMVDEIERFQKAQRADAPAEDEEGAAILRVREEQLQRLTSELEAVNRLAELQQRRVEELEKTVGQLQERNLDLQTKLADEKDAAVVLKRQLALEKKMKKPTGFVPSFINLGFNASPDIATVLSVLQAIYEDCAELK